MIAAPKAANGAAVKQRQLVGSILAATFLSSRYISACLRVPFKIDSVDFNIMLSGKFLG